MTRLRRCSSEADLNPTCFDRYECRFLLSSVGNENGTARDQNDAEPIWQRKPFTQEEHRESRHEDDAELVDWSNARGIPELQGAEVANPRSACRGTR